MPFKNIAHDEKAKDDITNHSRPSLLEMVKPSLYKEMVKIRF
jgi:hypothetical protein